MIRLFAEQAGVYPTRRNWVKGGIGETYLQDNSAAFPGRYNPGFRYFRMFRFSSSARRIRGCETEAGEAGSDGVA
jgi:hypothetical protein